MAFKPSKLLAGVLILGAFVTYMFFATVGTEKLLSTISAANPAYILLAAAVFLTSHVAGAFGLWHLLDKGAGRGFMLKAQIAGYFINNITPAIGYGGEFVKADIISRRTNKPRVGVLAAIFVQRVVHFAPFILMLFVSAGSLALKNNVGGVSYLLLVASVFAAITGGILMLFVSRRPRRSDIAYKALESLVAAFGRMARWVFPGKTPLDAKGSVQNFRSDVLQILWRKSTAIPAFYTLVSLFAEIIPLFLIIASIGHNSLPAAVVVLSYTIAVLVGTIPITPGGLGTYDASLAGMLSLFGMPLADAVAASFIYRIIQYWMTNALGVVMLARIRK